MRGLEKKRMKRDRQTHTQTHTQRTSRLYDRIGPVGRFDEKCGRNRHELESCLKHSAWFTPFYYYKEKTPELPNPLLPELLKHFDLI